MLTGATRGGSPPSQQQHLFHQRPVFFEVLGRIDEESSFRASIASQNDCSSHQSSTATSLPQDDRRQDRASVSYSQQHDHPKQQNQQPSVVAAATTPSANHNPPNEQIRRENEALFDECKALESQILQMRQNSSLLHMQSNLTLQDLQTDIDQAIREQEAVRASCRELEEQIDTVRNETNQVQQKIQTAEETLRQQQKQKRQQHHKDPTKQQQ